MSEMKLQISVRIFLVLLVVSFVSCKVEKPKDSYRIIVSTDIGGTDFDDYQSMVHLFLYADTLDIEGIISSPFGDGRKEHILEAIDAYEIDYPKLVAHNKEYPTPNYLRSISKQGALTDPGLDGYSNPTEGSEWIVKCARKDDPRPLYVLIWGGIEDLAQALHDAPDILPKLRVYFIGGPNKKWSVNAYQYIAEHFPELWMIESNATYRGWFVGGEQTGRWGNTEFVETCVKPYGAMGNYFYKYGKTMKMGDTPSLAYLLKGTPEDPTQPSWGGQYIKAWQRPHKKFERTTNENDSIERFGVLELCIPFETNNNSETHYATLDIDRLVEGAIVNDTVKFLFSPKDVKTYEYTILSNIVSLNELKGVIRSYSPPVANRQNPDPNFPNWFTDDPLPVLMEEGHIGIKTINCWRKDFLTDFQKRMSRL